MTITETPKGAELRQWARQCGAQATLARSAEERDRLLRMRNSLLELADNEDWLSGIWREPVAIHQTADPDGSRIGGSAADTKPDLCRQGAQAQTP